MRSSSIKSLVIVSSVVFTLSLSTPAEARSSQPPNGARTTIQRAVGKVLHFFGISSNAQPGDPIPNVTGPVTSTFTPPSGTTTIR